MILISTTRNLKYLQNQQMPEMWHTITIIHQSVEKYSRNWHGARRKRPILDTSKIGSHHPAWRRVNKISFQYLGVFARLAVCFLRNCPRIREKRRKRRSISCARAESVYYVRTSFTDGEDKRAGKIREIERGERRGTICERQISKENFGASRWSAATGQVAYGRPVAAVPSQRTRRVPPGETSHSYKTDGLVAPRVSPGSRLAWVLRLLVARAHERTNEPDKWRGRRISRCANRD